MELLRIAFQFIAIVRVEVQFHVGNNEDEPGPTGKLLTCARHKKKECQNGSNHANLSVTDYDDTMV